jgi:hypothetical protein
VAGKKSGSRAVAVAGFTERYGAVRDWPRPKPMKEDPRRVDMERGGRIGQGLAGGKQDRVEARVAEREQAS